MTLSRISITIPEDLVRQADERARALDRSRSWVLVEALRRYLAGRAADPVARVAEPAAEYRVAPVDASDAFADARRRRIEADLELSPEERLKHAEDLGLLARQELNRPPRRQVISFSDYEDFYRWKTTQGIGG